MIKYFLLTIMIHLVIGSSIYFFVSSYDKVYRKCIAIHAGPPMIYIVNKVISRL